MKNDVLSNLLGLTKPVNNAVMLSDRELEMSLDMLVNYRSRDELSAEALITECNEAMSQVDQLNLLAPGVIAGNEEDTDKFVAMMNGIVGEPTYTVEAAKDVAGRVVTALKDGLIRLLKALQAAFKLAVKAVLGYTALVNRIIMTIESAVFEAVKYTLQGSVEIYLALAGKESLDPGMIASGIKGADEFLAECIKLCEALSAEYATLPSFVDTIEAKIEAWYDKRKAKAAELEIELTKAELDKVASELETGVKAHEKATTDLAAAVDKLEAKVAAAKEGEITKEASDNVQVAVTLAKKAQKAADDTVKGSIAIVGSAAKAAAKASTKKPDAK